MVRETLGLRAHLHFGGPSALLKNLGPSLLMSLRTLAPSLFRAIRGIAQRAAGFRHLATCWGCLSYGLLVIRISLQPFLSLVELHLPSFFTSKPAAREYVD